MKLILQTELKSLLKSLVELLELNNENHWREYFFDILNRLDQDDLGLIAREIRKCYAGVDSFNDLVLQKDNEKLTTLRELIYKMTWKIASFNVRGS